MYRKYVKKEIIKLIDKIDTYSQEDIDNLMKSTLSVAQCDILNKLVFAGRYFMPADNTTLVPDDESDEIVEGNNGSEVTENTESE